MGEVIAVPLRSERRAAVVLAALRRLEAEYQVGAPAVEGTPRRIAGRARVGSRCVVRGLRHGAGGAVVAGIVGMGIAAVCASSSAMAPWLDGLLGGAGRAQPVLALGLALGVVIGLALGIVARLKASRGATNDSGSASGDVPWLVSYVTAEPDGSGTGQVRASVLRLMLPEAAEGRLKAILEWAAATSAT